MEKVFNNHEQKNLRQQLRNNATETEKLLWGVLRKKGLGVKFVRQYGIGKYIVDFDTAFFLYDTEVFLYVL